MFQRVLEFCEGQVTGKTEMPSMVMCSVPLRGNTLDCTVYETNIFK